MSISRSDLYRMGEPLGNGATMRKPGRGYVCGFGGDSSSSNTTKNETNNYDKRIVVDNGGLGIGGDNNRLSIVNNNSDAGLAETLGKKAIDSADHTVESAANMTLAYLNKVNENSANALTFAQTASERAMTFAFDAGKPDAALTQKWGQWVAIVGGIVAAGVAFKNLRGG